ncbi:MAG TPA: periplasmic heavy metal sensor [Polyangiaceae bacterium]
MSDKGKRLAILLAVSVALNIFFVGFYSARWIRKSPGHLGSFDTWGDRSALREKWKEQSGSLRGRREAVESARRTVRLAFAADPFEAEALAAALAALRGETNETQQAVDEAIVRFAATLGPEDRKRVAESRWFGNFEGRGALHAH